MPYMDSIGLRAAWNILVTTDVTIADVITADPAPGDITVAAVQLPSDPATLFVLGLLVLAGGAVWWGNRQTKERSKDARDEARGGSEDRPEPPTEDERPDGGPSEGGGEGSRSDE